MIKEKPDLIAAAVKSLLAAEENIHADKNWPSLIATRVRASAEEIAHATADFEFRIEFNKRFIDDLVSQAEWAIAAGLSKRPEGDLHTLLRSLVYEDAVKAVLPDRVTI